MHEAARFYVNFFLPSFKLQSKTRDGAKVTKKYDTPTTPYQRLLMDVRVTEEQKRQLREPFTQLDPISLLRQIREAQSKIARLEVGAACVDPARNDPSLDRFVRNLGTAWKDGEARSTHRKPASGPRAWRTRVDPFEDTWTIVEQWLSEEPDATAKELFQRLQSRVPELFQPGQLRTLQQRVKAWRTAIAKRLVLGVELESNREGERSAENKETVFD